MFSIAPIVSSLITLVESISLVKIPGDVVSLLKRVQRVLSFLPSFDTRVQLVIVSYGVPVVVFALLIFPFSSLFVAGDITLAVLLGFSITTNWAVFTCVLVLVVVRVAYIIWRYHHGSTAQREDVYKLVFDIKAHYMTGITSDGDDSCVNITNRVTAYCSYNLPTTCKKACNVVIAVVTALFAVLLAAVWKKTTIAVITGCLATLLAICALLSLHHRIASALSPLALRVVVVILEALYIPTTETLAELLHRVAPCDQCVASINASLFVESRFTCTSCEYGWRFSPSNQQWLNYNEDVVNAFGVFVCYIVVVVVVGLPAVEYYISYRALRVINSAYTVGGDDDEKLLEALSMLRTPAVYTFFMYKRRFAWYTIIAFMYKLIAATLSHVQTSLGFPFALLLFYMLQTVITALLRPYSTMVYFSLDVLLCSLNVLVSSLPVLVFFGVAVPSALFVALPAAASCVPIVLFAAMFVVLTVRRRRRQREDVIEVDGVEEDGCVVNERIEQLYDSVRLILEKDVIYSLRVYGYVLAVCGGLSSGYFFGYY